MLVKNRDRVINLDQITCFVRYKDVGLKFYYSFWMDCLDEEGSTYLEFRSMSERDEAFDKILDAYRWQRLVCDLG